MFHKKIIGLVVISIAGLLSQPVSANQVDEIQARGNLVCGTLGVTRGMAFIDKETRKLVGYEVDLCNEIAEHLGVTPKLKTVTVAGRIPELNQGRVDVIIGELTKTPERAEQVNFSTPYFIIANKVMVRENKGIESFEDLAEKKIATTKGSTQQQKLVELLPNATVLAFDTTAQAFLAFQQGKADGYSTDEVSLRTSKESLGDKGGDMIILPRELSVEEEGVGVSKKAPKLLNSVNETFVELEKSGKADELFMKWFGPGTEVGFVERPFRIDGRN